MQFDTSVIFDGLLQGIWQALGYLFMAWQMWAMLLVLVAVKLGPQLYESWRLRKADMPEIDRMTGLEFEKYLEILFARLGYQVERTPYRGDQGGDLIVTRNGERTLVQAKRHRKAIGNKAIQEAAAARPHYQCHRAMVVANQEFTRPARDLARSNQVELWGRRKLAEVVIATQPTSTTRPVAKPRKAAVKPTSATPSPIARQATPTGAPTCPRCGRPMVLRDSARGRFWGCSSFPKCRHTAVAE